MVPKKRPYDRHAPRNRRCKVCVHVERARIECLMAGGASRESVARRFDISPHSVWRHWRNHVHEDDKGILAGAPAQLANLAEKAAKEGMSVYDYLGIFRSKLMRSLDATAAANDNVGLNRTVQTLLQVMDRIGEISGEISRATAGLTVNVNNSQNTLVQMTDPLIAKLQSGLLRCLSKHPEARADVIVMLNELEAGEYRPLPNGHAALPAPIEIEARANG